MKIYLLIFLLLSNLFLLKAETPPTPSGESFGSDVNHGGGNQATPINDYAGLLIASGFIAAMAIYFKKEQLSKQNK